MHVQSRRAMFGTINYFCVSTWHVFNISRATYLEIWHGLGKNRGINACQKWHVNVVTQFFKLNNPYFSNKLINHKFQSCNPSCEVCEKKSLNIIENHHHLYTREVLVAVPDHIGF